MPTLGMAPFPGGLRVASDFTASAEAAFLKGLRNYIAHRQLPVAQSQEAYTVRSVRISFILPTGPLLEWDGWNANTRAWIAGRGNDIPIVDVVDTYARLADEFDRWLVSGWRTESATERDSQSDTLVPLEI
jgi:hypothetical protein